MSLIVKVRERCPAVNETSFMFSRACAWRSHSKTRVFRRAHAASGVRGRRARAERVEQTNANAQANAKRARGKATRERASERAGACERRSEGVSG
eukprot:5324706-Pleurochrysis_carterae.AAC.2